MTKFNHQCLILNKPQTIAHKNNENQRQTDLQHNVIINNQYVNADINIARQNIDKCQNNI